MVIDGGDEGFTQLLTPLDPRRLIYSCRSPNKRLCRASLHVKVPQHPPPFPIDSLPDECLFEVLRRLPANHDRASAASVSRRWLSTLTSIQPHHIVSDSPLNCCDVADRTITRFLIGTEISDIRLAALTARANGFGGLGTLWIRGDGSARITDAGLSVLAHGSCGSLRFLSFSNTRGIGDEGLRVVAGCCKKLEKLDLNGCPWVSDQGLVAVADNCLNLSCLSIQRCKNVGDLGLRAVGKHCPLRSVAVIGCPRVGDVGVVGLIVSASFLLTRIALQNLDVSDVTLAIIGLCGRGITDLMVSGLRNVNERGFWAMGNARGLLNLKSAVITACHGATDFGLEAVVRGCPALKKLSLNKCVQLSDNGLVAIARAATALESLHVIECNGISLSGIGNAISSFASEFKTLDLLRCTGIREPDTKHIPLIGAPSSSIRTITVQDCQFFGDLCLKTIIMICLKLQKLELNGKLQITCPGLCLLINCSNLQLRKANLSGCADVVDDDFVSAFVRTHGRTLRLLNLNGCTKVTDDSLGGILDNCDHLDDLDLSGTAVTDCGIFAFCTLEPPLIRIFSLSGCPLITDHCLYSLRYMPHLEGLNLRHCKQISLSAIESLRMDMKSCDIFF